jgi:hypothetical protein
MRHGTTEMNVYLRDVKAYGSPGFRDPLLYVTMDHAHQLTVHAAGLFLGFC